MTIRNLDRYKQFQRRLYFQDGTPSARERDDMFRQGKVVLLVTCSVHGTEIGATQMALELVHRLATDDSPATRKILDNVIVLLVPSANPDGQIAVTDWFNQNQGTPFEASPLPSLDHPYVGHDSNRDMYMLTQKESQYLAKLAWQDWFPAVWLDQHQMGNTGPRMFVMPATDPINPNVHPVIYRWNGILGQSQAAALEAIVHALETQRLSLTQIEDSLTRHQRAKERFLASSVAPRPLPPKALRQVLGREDHRRIADEMARFA